MGTIRVEPESPIEEERCGACGGTNRLLHGYVVEDEQPHGLYFIEWCEGPHGGRGALLTVGLGRFDENAAASDRRSFSVDWRAVGMGLTSTPARDRPELLGPFVPRDEALALPGIDHLWHVIDHIVRDDPRAASVTAWLEAGAHE